MPSPSAFLITLVMTSVLLGGCDGSSPSAAGRSSELAEDVAMEQFEGTWLREYGEGTIHARRILVLEPDNSFVELVRVTDGKGQVSEQRHEGTWLFDGTNLKRKYTLMNGKAPSRLNLPFATFQVKFESRNEFVGVDHIHRNEVRYKRMSRGTLP